MTRTRIPHLDTLLKKGVAIPSPESVEIGPEVDPDRISGEGVVLHAGCKLYGRSTMIMRGVRLGREAPVTVDGCWLGPEVELRGGFFQQAVFLHRSSAGSGAHVREGTILEEEASIAHTVGLKQTILFPYVTLGSLINFCDCLMAGGTDRKHHSEVGSSYIHFNYTPNQDKATASLIGDVPRGVLLNQPPIFLGGQGGLVGPCRLAYGTVIAAGAIHRKDELREHRLIIGGGGGRGGNVPYTPGLYRSDKRIVDNNIIYIANLLALRQWYRYARALFVGEDFPPALLTGLLETVQTGIAERIHRLGELCLKVPAGHEAAEEAEAAVLRQKNALRDAWPVLKTQLEAGLTIEGDTTRRDDLLGSLEGIAKRHGKDYLSAIKCLPPSAAAAACTWLQSVVDGAAAAVRQHLPY